MPILMQPKPQQASSGPAHTPASAAVAPSSSPSPFFPQLPAEFPTPRAYSPSHSSSANQPSSRAQTRHVIHHPLHDEPSTAQRRSVSPLSVLLTKSNSGSGSSFSGGLSGGGGGQSRGMQAPTDSPPPSDIKLVIRHSPASPTSVSTTSYPSRSGLSQSSADTLSNSSASADAPKRATPPSLHRISNGSSSGSSSSSLDSQSQSQSRSNPGSRRGSGSGLKESDNLRLPSARPAVSVVTDELGHESHGSPSNPYAVPQGVDLSKPAKLSLGEMLARDDNTPERSLRRGQAMSRTPQPQYRTLRPDEMKKFAGCPELFNQAESLSRRHRRPSTPQPRSRTLGLQADDVRIDADLMPNFVFLKSKKPLMAAHLPPPSPSGPMATMTHGLGTVQPGSGKAGTPTSSGRGLSPSHASLSTPGSNKNSPRTTPRNMELASLHAHASPVGLVRKLSNSGKKGSTRTQIIVQEAPPRKWEVSPKPSATAAASAAAALTVAGLEPIHVKALLSPHGSVLGANGQPLTPTAALLSPVILGSGILQDVESTSTRVVDSMIERGDAVVLPNEAALVSMVTEHRNAFGRAARHQDGEFVIQMLQRKYNTDEGEVHGQTDLLLQGRSEDAAQVLSAQAMGLAVPFAPSQWFFSPSNLQLVLSYHLVLAALNFGLDDVPPPPPPATMTLLPPSTDLADAAAAAAAADRAAAAQRGPAEPYSALDLARALATVARSTPHAFDADRLSRMDPVRLGSWLQPEIFAAALEQHPELLLDDGNALGSPSALHRKIAFTYPALEERARILREVGFTLLKHFGGSTWKLVTQADHSCAKLVETLTSLFPSFRDASIYKGRFVFHYTRAQDFVRNVWIAFHGTSLGAFSDIADLHPRADSILPAILHALGMLRYSKQMSEYCSNRIDFSDLPSEVETEVRCASGWVVKQICKVLANLDIQVLPIQMGQETKPQRKRDTLNEAAQVTLCLWLRSLAVPARCFLSRRVPPFSLRRRHPQSDSRVS